MATDKTTGTTVQPPKPSKKRDAHEALKPQPVPALQKVGFHGTMRDFNERVQAVHDAHERTQGYRPTPGLTLVAAKSQVPTPELPKLFDIPRTKAAAKSWSFFKETNGVIETTNPLDSAAAVTPGSDTTPDNLKFAADRFEEMSNDEKRAFFQALEPLTPKQRMRLLRRAGYLSLGSHPIGREEVRIAGAGELGVPSKAADYVWKVPTAFFGGLALGLPTIGYEEGKAVKESVEQRSLKPLARTQVELAKATGQAAVEVAKDPLAPENIGFAAQFILGGATAVAGGASRAAAAGAQLKAGKGVGKALAAPKAEGGSLLRKPPAGRTKVKYGETEFELLNTENAALRPIQLGVRRLREKRAQKKHEDGFQAVPAGAIPVFEGRRGVFARTFAWEKKLGREADKRARLERQLRLMTRDDLVRVQGWSEKFETVREKLPAASLKGLSRGEQMAIIVRTLDDPDPLTTMRQFHSEKLLEGPKEWEPLFGKLDPDKWEASHRQKLRDLDAAEKALAKPSDRFREALALVDRAVAEMEFIKINEAHLNALTAEGRVAKAGEVFRTGKPVDPEAPLPDKLTDTSAYMPFVSSAKRKRQAKDLFRGSRLNFLGGIGRKDLKHAFPEVYHQFTGKAIIAGDYRIDATGLIGEALGSAVQGAYRMSQYKTLLAAATPTKKSQYDRAILKPDADGWPDSVKAFLMKPDEGQVTKQDAIGLSKQDWNEMVRVIFPGETKDGKWTVPTEKMEDVLWVDERLLSPQAFTQPLPSKLPRGLQLVQDTYRVPSLYLKPSYALNLLSNQVMSLIYTGPLAPWNTARAMFRKGWLDDSTFQSFSEMVGVGRFGSYVDEAYSSRASRRIAHFWNRATDQHARVGAAFHYAAELGYKTGDDLKRLVTNARKDRDSKEFEDVLEIKERTNKAMVQMDNLTWFESNILRHVLYVYPWRRGQAIWSLRTLVEKPVKASVVAAIGREEGEEIQDVFLNRVPEWFERNGYLPTSFDANGDPSITAPATLSTWGDMQTLVDPDLARMLGPVPMVVAKRFQLDAHGNEFARQHEVKKWLDAFRAVYSQLPQARVTGEKRDAAVPDVDVTNIGSLITRMNAADNQPVLSPGFWGGLGYLVAGPAFTEREVNRLALQADWYKELPQDERHKFNVHLRGVVLGLQAQALGKPVPRSVERVFELFNDREKFRYEWQQKNQRDFAPEEQTRAELAWYRKNGLVPEQDLPGLERAIKQAPDADAHEQLRQDFFDAYADPDGAWQDWQSDVGRVAALSNSKVVNKRLAELAKDGILTREARSVGLPVKALREYGRTVLAWYEKNREWRDRLDAVSDPDEQNILWQEYREWLDAQDKPVTVAGKTLPSPARIEWARWDEDTRRAVVADRATRPWSQLSGFDKELLGRKVDPKVAEGWRRLEEIVVEQKQSLPAGERRFPPGHELALAKYVDRNYAPGFYKDWLFSREPLVRRLQQFEPIRRSRHAASWQTVLGAAASYAGYLKSDDYNKTLVRDTWRDYVRGQLQPWAEAEPGFRDELQMYGPDVLYRLLDS